MFNKERGVISMIGKVIRTELVLRANSLRDTCIALALGTIMLILLSWIRGTTITPVNDTGGYLAMIDYFRKSGNIDYMRWCQPTFIGTLVVAIPWTFLFGSSAYSLSNSVIAQSAILVVLVFALARQYCGRLPSVLVSGAVCIYNDFFVIATSFMTDVPYGVYLLLFLIAYAAVIRRVNYHSQNPWLLLGVSYALAILTRPFAVIAIPCFGLLALWGGWEYRFAHRMLFCVGSVLSFLCFLLLWCVAENRLSPLEQTALREIFVDGDYYRFNLRTTALSLLNLSYIALPVLLLSRHSLRLFSLNYEVIVPIATFLLGIYFWRRGLIEPLMENVPFTNFLFLAKVVGAAVGAAIAYKLAVTELKSPGSPLSLVLLTLISFQLALMPIMQHPMLRYAFPAYLCLIILVTIGGLSLGRFRVSIVFLLIAFNGTIHALNTKSNILTEVTVYRVAEQLLASGIPVDQIDAGWNWFCSKHLHPGLDNQEDYRVRYERMQATARYHVVVEDCDFRNGSHDQFITPIPSRRTCVRVVDRSGDQL